MLSNISYNNKTQRDLIDELVGKPYSIRNRLKIGGIGSPKLFVSSCSKEIDSLFVLDNNENICNIEIRPKGLILRFRSLLETYALIIPYYKLNIFKGNSNTYSIHMEHHKISIYLNSVNVRKFFKKIQEQKVYSTQDYL